MPAKTEQVYDLEGRHPLLDLTADEVARLPRADREKRVRLLMAESLAIFHGALDAFVVEPGLDYLGAAVLFSGGNDSTVLAHLARPYVDLAVHANTGVGVEETRVFVRKVCADWGLWLEERHPPVSYRDLVLEQGFPGPGQHFKMFQRLKERAILAVRNDLVSRPRRERLVYLAGRRKDESARRSNVPLWEREGSLVWVSPLAYWTKLDLNTYRLLAARRGDPVPVNRVSELIHMSGECLCGAFAKRDELEQVEQWFPDDVAAIRALEREVYAVRGADERCTWGWGAYRTDKAAQASRVGALCSSCTVADPEVVRVT